MNCCLQWWNYTFYWRIIPRLREQEKMCVSWEWEGVVCIIFVCFEKVLQSICFCWLISICRMRLLVSSTCSLISYIKQNNPWIFHSICYLCFHMPCQTFPRFILLFCSSNSKKVFQNKRDKNNKSSTICILNANRMPYTLPRCLVSLTLSCNTPTPVSLLLFSDSQIIFTVNLRWALYKSFFFFFLSLLLLKISHSCS